MRLAVALLAAWRRLSKGPEPLRLEWPELELTDDQIANLNKSAWINCSRVGHVDVTTLFENCAMNPGIAMLMGEADCQPAATATADDAESDYKWHAQISDDHVEADSGFWAVHQGQT
jgi:hypothetical protein